MANLAAKEKPSLIIHAWDYHYRAKQCKLNEDCHDKTGFGWKSWEKDFFHLMRHLKIAKKLRNQFYWNLISKTS